MMTLADVLPLIKRAHDDCLLAIRPFGRAVEDRQLDPREIERLEAIDKEFDKVRSALWLAESIATDEGTLKRREFDFGEKVYRLRYVAKRALPAIRHKPVEEVVDLVTEAVLVEAFGREIPPLKVFNPATYRRRRR